MTGSLSRNFENAYLRAHLIYLAELFFFFFGRSFTPDVLSHMSTVVPIELQMNSGYHRKREMHNIWSMVIPEKATPLLELP